jgi:hypothetical protein
LRRRAAPATASYIGRVRQLSSAAFDTVDTLVLDLLEWIGPNRRPYPEVMEAWRTSCPHLPVWEAANERGFITRHHAPGRGTFVSVSSAGAEHLRMHRRRDGDASRRPAG